VYGRRQLARLLETDPVVTDAALELSQLRIQGHPEGEQDAVEIQDNRAANANKRSARAG
jgi:hypothetical protein